jgi:hypothetical protein
LFPTTWTYGKVELRPDRQFFDQELEVVVARQSDYCGGGVGGDNTQGRRHRPAEWSGLAAVDPVAGLEHL